MLGKYNPMRVILIEEFKIVLKDCLLAYGASSDEVEQTNKALDQILIQQHVAKEDFLRLAEHCPGVIARLTKTLGFSTSDLRLYFNDNKMSDIGFMSSAIGWKKLK